MRRVTLSILGVCLVALLVGVAQADTVYNFTNCFSPTGTAPPNASPYTDSQGGLWAYGEYSASNPVPSTFAPFTLFETDTSGLEIWTNPASPGLGYVGYQYNTINQSKNGYYYNLDEPTMQIAYQPAAIRWTAPAAGTVTLNVTYEAVCTYSGNYSYSLPQSEIFQVSGGNTTIVDPATTMAAYQATHNYTGTLTVAAGDTFDFAGIGVTPSSSWTPAVSISGTIDFAAGTGPVHNPGDVNGDKQVDINDLTIVLTNYGQTGMVWSQGAIDGDPAGTVDINDLTIVLTDYGVTYSAGIKAVPEPGALALIAAGLAGLLAYAWRKRR